MSCGFIDDGHHFVMINGGRIGNNLTDWAVSAEWWDVDIPNGTWVVAREIYTSQPTYAVPFFPLSLFDYHWPSSSSVARPYTGANNWMTYNIGQNRLYGTFDMMFLNEVRVRESCK